MNVSGYGNACVRVQAGGQDLLFDPYLKDLVPAPEPRERLEARRAAFLEAGPVLITHGHLDHLGSVTALYRGRDVRVYCTRTPARTLTRQGFEAEHIRVIAPGERVEMEGAAVLAYQAKHCRFNAGELKNVVLHHRMFRRLGQLVRLVRLHIRHPAGGECLFYEIQAEGKRVQILGSAGLDPKVDYPTGADLLILPYQGRSDMARCCMTLVDRLRPKRVLLDHYDDAFPPLTCREDTAPFVAAMREKYPQVPCGELGENESVTL